MALRPPLLIRENMNYIVSNSIDIAIRKTSNLILTFFHSFVIVDQKTSKKKNYNKKNRFRFPLRKHRRRLVRRTQSESDVNVDSAEYERIESSPKASSKLEAFKNMLFNRINASKDSPKKLTSSSSTTWMEKWYSIFSAFLRVISVNRKYIIATVLIYF